MTHFWHPRTGTTAVLPHLAAATEFFVFDLVAQHDPQSDPEFASCLFCCLRLRSRISRASRSAATTEWFNWRS